MVCQLSAEAIGGTKEMWYVVLGDTGEYNNNNYQIQLIAHSLFETVSQIAAGNQVCCEWE